MKFDNFSNDASTERGYVIDCPCCGSSDVDMAGPGGSWYNQSDEYPEYENEWCADYKCDCGMLYSYSSVDGLEAGEHNECALDESDDPEVMTDGGVDKAGNPTLDEIDDLCDSGWRIKWGGRAGRRYPPNNRLVRVINDDGAFREYYVSEDEWDILDSRRQAEQADDGRFLGERV